MVVEDDCFPVEHLVASGHHKEFLLFIASEGQHRMRFINLVFTKIVSSNQVMTNFMKNSLLIMVH